MARVVRRLARRRSPSTLEIAERCDTDDRARQAADPALRRPDGERGGDYLRALVDDGPAQPLRRPAPRRGARARGHGARRHRQHGLQRLLPDRLGLRRPTRRSNGIAVGPGRGSAAGSIVAYCLEITDVDPLRYDLLFERFLNPERVSMPDIDIDFSVRGRERVIRYVTEKYGADRVAQIVTFGKMFPRAATRDAARVLGHDYGDRRPPGQADPRPASWAARRASRTACTPGAELAAEVDARPDRQADRRRRAGPRGHRPQRVDPRRRGRDRRPPADRHRAAAARRRRHGRGRREGLPHGHAVLDEADRGDRPAEDGLPRACATST